MIPTIDGTMHHFAVAGLYDALFVMQDSETKTLWNHITGEAVHGELIDRKLSLSNLLQMNAKQALAVDPNISVAISSRPFAGSAQRSAPGNPEAALSSRFIETLGTEDARRPRMDMGLGVWSGNVRRYYPMETIRKHGEAFIDVVDNKSVLIYIDPESSTPAALFVNAKGAKFRGKEIRLDDGTSIRSGLVVGHDGQPLRVERPQQLFTRWYGFALTFPGCEVFGQ